MRSILVTFKLSVCLMVWLCCTCVNAQPVFKVLVTVDWEGYSLEAENIAEMQAFRQQFPNIPFVQLLNPVYFVRDQASAGHHQKAIKSTLLNSDVQGLHLHAWRSMMNACHVPFRHGPTFASEAEGCGSERDCGYTVSLELAYSAQDLSQLLMCSQQLMVEHGFDKPVYFRAGGWQGGPKLFAALAKQGFIWDSSTIAADLLTTRWPIDSSIVKMLKRLHPTATPLDQPHLLNQQLKEYPNNSALADYTTTEQIIDLYKQLLAHGRQVMVLGFHQETAVDYLPRLRAAIPRMQEIADEQGVSLQWVTY